MGASDWFHRVAYQADLAVVLAQLRQHVFDEQDYYWPDDPESDSWETEYPATLADLMAGEQYREEGRHSILDITTVIGENEPDGPRTLRPLTAAERQDLWGKTTVTPADLPEDLAAEPPPYGPRWSGHCITLHGAAGKPAELLIWGLSGD